MDTTFLIYLTLILVGLAMGSFAGAMVWRLRARQLKEDKAEGEDYDKKEYKRLLPLTQNNLQNDRSRCLTCKHPLAWYDLIPLVSWVTSRGKCRYCGGFIGWFEPVIEIATALLFVISFAFWPFLLNTALDWTQFIVWLVVCVMMVILIAYDSRWYILPNRVVFPLIGASAIWSLLVIVNSALPTDMLFSLAGSIVLLPGVYYLLWLVSKGAWIGFGDIKLNIALALLVVEWQLAFLVLLLANLIGCLVVIPGMLAGKITRKTHIPFGPFLIFATIIAVLFGSEVVAWYMQMTLQISVWFGL